MQVLVGGGLGESETGGPIANIIPKSGGNTFSGSAFFSGTQSGLAVGQHHRRRCGLRAFRRRPPSGRTGTAAAPSADRSPAIGFWFFGNVRTVGIAQVVAAGLAPNLYLGRPDAGGSTHPTPGVETRFTESKLDFSARLTGQVTPTQSRDVLVSAAVPLPRIDADDQCGRLPRPRRRLDRRRRSVRRPSPRRRGPGTRMVRSA